MSQKQALIFGASGISGWALARECLTYPSESTFSRVLALSNQPLLKTEFLLSEKEAERLDVYSGIDLAKGADESVRQKFKGIPGIENTTHVFYTAYGGHRTEHAVLKEINTTFFSTALSLVTHTCPNIGFFSLQTGGKTYGFEFYGQPGMTWNAPHKESEPRLPEPYASKMFYYPQVDLLVATARKCNWRYCEVRPEVVVGFTPRSNGMGFAQALGIWLSMYRDLEGEGSVVVFPGDEVMWEIGRTDTSQDILAHFSIYASLNPDKTSGRAFNIGDEFEGSKWKDDWSVLCGYFGLRGVGPDENGKREGKLKGVEWVLGNKHKWGEWIEKNGLRDEVGKSSWDMLKVVLEYLPMDRRLDLREAERIGFGEIGMGKAVNRWVF